MRVLIAEDDAGLRGVLVRGLREQGYVVDAVGDGDTAMRYLRSYEYELANLDWRMPGRLGLEVVQQIRRRQLPTAVLMLTARDAPADRVTGLDQGADDYLVKPFDVGELLARLRALQRRPASVQQPQLVVGDLVFDPAARMVRVGSQAPELTVTEFGILEMLVRRSPAVVARRSIAMHVWDGEADAMGRTRSTFTWPGCGPSWPAGWCGSRPFAASGTGSWPDEAADPVSGAGARCAGGAGSESAGMRRLRGVRRRPGPRGQRAADGVGRRAPAGAADRHPRVWLARVGQRRRHRLLARLHLAGDRPRHDP